MRSQLDGDGGSNLFRVNSFTFWPRRSGHHLNSSNVMAVTGRFPRQPTAFANTTGSNPVRATSLGWRSRPSARPSCHSSGLSELVCRHPARNAATVGTAGANTSTRNPAGGDLRRQLSRPVPGRFVSCLTTHSQPPAVCQAPSTFAAGFPVDGEPLTIESDGRHKVETDEIDAHPDQLVPRSSTSLTIGRRFRCQVTILKTSSDLPRVNPALSRSRLVRPPPGRWLGDGRRLV